MRSLFREFLTSNLYRSGTSMKSDFFKNAASLNETSAIFLKRPQSESEEIFSNWLFTDCSRVGIRFPWWLSLVSSAVAEAVRGHCSQGQCLVECSSVRPSPCLRFLCLGPH